MYMESAGCGWHIEITGSGAARVAVLHGWGCSGALMKPITDALAPEHRVLTADFPGHGESGRPPEPWGVPEYAEGLYSILRSQGFLPCDVVAHSFGCRVAIYLAAKYPEAFSRMVLTGAAGIRKQPSAAQNQKTTAYQRGKKLCTLMRKFHFLQGAADRLQESLIQKYGSRDYKALDPEMRQTFNRVINLDLSDRLPDIKASTLLIWGDHDTETPLWMGQKMEKNIPDCGLVTLEGGHFVYAEQAPAFNRIMTHFLKAD